MPSDREKDQLNQDEFSLDAILAEFGSGSRREESAPEEQAPLVKPPEKPQSPPKEGKAGSRKPPEGKGPTSREQQKGPDWREDTIPFPLRPSQGSGSPTPGKRGVVTAFPGGKQPAPPEEDDTKVLEFPAQEPESPVAAGIDRLRKAADEFAGHMYEEEGAENAQSVRRAEKLIPGVDEEEPLQPRRKPRRKRPPAPDLPPSELAKRYARGLKGLRLRLVLVFLLLLPLGYLTLRPLPPLPEEIPLSGSPEVLRCYVMAALQGLALLLGWDVFFRGLVRPFQGRMGMETLTVLANLAAVADALTLPNLSGEPFVRQPFSAVAALALWCAMWGDLRKRRGSRLACHTAASASEPYRVTRDEEKWNGRDTYAKWSGPVTGFGSQVQGMDGAERIYQVFAPVLLIACIVFSVLSSVGRDRPQELLWCLAATLTAAAPLSATLCFGLPWLKLCRRLAKSGAALAGWEGVTSTTGASNLLLYDADLFPPGSVKLNGHKIFSGFSTDKVIADTATVIRDGGGGLEKVFHDLLRSQGTVYRRGERLEVYEGGGLSEVIRGDQVLVGSASFMVLMDVKLPQGLNVKNAVFCAINGELAGIFALKYQLPGAVAPALDSLIRNRITPVLATRDFNLIPDMLRQRFKLPAEKMEFPPVDRRRELSAEDQDHSDSLTAVLCREGLGPYAETVVGGKRLRRAVRMSAVLSCIGSTVGAVLAFYLTFVGGYASLTPVNLGIFLLMWLVPTPLISGWVDRY